MISITVDGTGVQMFFEVSRAVILYQAEEGTIQFAAVFRKGQILFNEELSRGVNRDKSCLAALALDAKMHDAVTALHVAHP